LLLSVNGKSTTEKMVTEAGKTLKLLKSSEVHILAYLFRNAHAIAKQNEFLMEMRNMWWRFRFLVHLDQRPRTAYERVTDFITLEKFNACSACHHVFFPRSELTKVALFAILRKIS
jgi:hypothetical protein